MEETKVNAIVLGGRDYKEKDKLVDLFTLEQGIVSVLFRSVKSANAKLKSAKEMFSFGDFIYVAGKFNVVTSAEIIDTFYSITKDIKKYYTACEILKIIKYVLPPGEQNVALFLNTLKALKTIAYDSADNLIVLNKFLVIVFEGVGYKFALNACNTCGGKFINYRYMNLEYGDITCSNCKTLNCIEITPAEYSALRLLSITEFERLTTLKLNGEILKSLFNLLNKNFEYRFNKKLELPDILK